jgi:glycosyltransferase involved in cell wall biosynthesis
MAAFWRACDVAVVPSNEWTESFGMVAVEAMAMGLPVVATNAGGLTEVVEAGETGALFDAGDAEQLGYALRAYLAEPSLRARHGAAARARCEALFDIDRCAAEFEALIRARRNRS